MYYNADLLEIAPELQYTRLGFIDDIAFGVQGKSGRSNICMLQKIMKETENWRRKHGAQFERSKYILVHFTRNRNTESNTPLPINGFTIEPSEEAKYLGVIFDKELHFHTHLQYVAKKGTTATMALSEMQLGSTIQTHTSTLPFGNCTTHGLRSSNLAPTNARWPGGCIHTNKKDVNNPTTCDEGDARMF
jgi:hypothetical protein